MRKVMDMNRVTESHLSFLKARDPSIITGNRALLRNSLRINLAKHKLQENSTIPEVEDEEGTIQIYLRLKDARDTENLYKIDDNEINCYVPNSSHSSKNIKDGDLVIKKYIFSRIFDANATQEDVFDNVVKQKVFKFINGENSTLMSYGASGSGKTFTIVGTISHPGIIPRTLEYLFRTLPALSDMPLIKPSQSGEVYELTRKNGQEELNRRNNLLSIAAETIDKQHINTYMEMQRRLSTEPVGILEDFSNVILGVWVSFAEIYNEHVYDLLTPVQNLKANARPKLQLGSFNENTYIKNLTNINVSSGIEAYQILQYGLHNLNYAATSINSHSSRSHCIFTIKIAQAVKGTNASRLNYFNFCDLAGSERLKKTLNVGDRLKESNNINTSLLVLGRCISCIRESQKKNVNKLIPFRDSKLTRLFQRALSGYETLSMLVNMNPSLEMFDESQHVLNFSAIAKDIVVKHVPIKPKRRSRFSTQLASRSTAYSDLKEFNKESEICKLMDLIDKLQAELEHQDKRFLEEEQRIREEITNEYMSIIEDIERIHKKTIELNEARHREALEIMKEKYENKAQPKELIVIVDSSSDDDEHPETSNTENFKSELDELKMETVRLKRTISMQNKEKEELKQTLEDAKIEFQELQENYERRINELLVENIYLKDVNSQLNTEIDEYSKLLEQEQEEILP